MSLFPKKVEYPFKYFKRIDCLVLLHMNVLQHVFLHVTFAKFVVK